MPRKKLTRPTIKKQGTYVDGTVRHIIEHEISGKIYSKALDPIKLWKLLFQPSKKDQISKED